MLKMLGSVHSGGTVRNHIRYQYYDIDQTMISHQVVTLLKNLLNRMQQFRGNRRAEVVLAIDLHDEEHYGDLLYDQSRNRLVFKTPKGKSD